MTTFKDAKITKSLNLKRELCACPLVNTHEALKTIEPGEVLEVLTDHRPAAQDLIPGFCRFQRCPVQVIEEGDAPANLSVWLGRRVAGKRLY